MEEYITDKNLDKIINSENVSAVAPSSNNIDVNAIVSDAAEIENENKSSEKIDDATKNDIMSIAHKLGIENVPHPGYVTSFEGEVDELTKRQAGMYKNLLHSLYLQKSSVGLSKKLIHLLTGRLNMLSDDTKKELNEDGAVLDIVNMSLGFMMNKLGPYAGLIAIPIYIAHDKLRVTAKNEKPLNEIEKNEESSVRTTNV
jgi:hypothetical protein